MAKTRKAKVRGVIMTIPKAVRHRAADNGRLPYQFEFYSADGVLVKQCGSVPIRHADDLVAMMTGLHRLEQSRTWEVKDGDGGNT